MRADIFSWLVTLPVNGALRSSTRLPPKKTAIAAAVAAVCAVATGYSGGSRAAELTAAENPPQSIAPNAGASSEQDLEAIVVTGSRLKSGFQSPTPVTVIGADDFAERAATNVADVVNEAPAFSNTTSPTANTAGAIGPAGINALDLRGLGNTRTLILEDGLRLPPNGLQFNVVDTNAIPSVLVDRVEVVTGGASAAYGSDAVAGVVNFILKKKLQGFEGTLQTGISQRSDNKSDFVSVAWGGDVFHGAHLIVGAEFDKEHGVGDIEERDWGQQQVGLLSLATRPAGVPSQIFSNNVAYNNVSPGSLVLSGPLRGLNFLPGGQTSNFDFGNLSAGNLMNGSTSNVGTSPNNYQNIKDGSDRAALLARLSFDVFENTSAWFELGYNYLQARGVGAYPYQGFVTVLDTNPYLPASVLSLMQANGLTSLQIGRANNEIGGLQGRGTQSQVRLLTGLEGKVFGDWSWDAHAQYGRIDYVYNVFSEVRTANYLAASYPVLAANGSIVCGPTATNPNLTAAQAAQVQPGCVPLNVFGLGSPSAAALNYVDGNERVPAYTDQIDATVNLAGNLFKLPAGPLAVAVGGEAKSEHTVANQSPERGLFYIGNLAGYEGRITVEEAYAEATAPVLKDLPLVRSLDLNGAVRYAHYSTAGGATTWKVGLTWEPADWVRFRGTRSRDIRAPNVSETDFPGFNASAQVVNPATGVSGVVNTLSPGNPSLKPEVANTTTVGAVFSPNWSWASGLRLSVDYYDIKLSGVIQADSAQDTLNKCYIQHIQEYCSFVTTDGTAFGVSTVTLGPLNLSQLVARGIDTEISYPFALDTIGLPGHLNLSLLTTYVDHLESLFNGSSTENAEVTIPRWRENLRATYSLNDLTAYLQMIGFSKTKYSQSLQGPGDPGYDPASPTSISNNWFPAIAYLNGGASYGVSRNFTVYGTIDNLLDKQPPSNVLYNHTYLYDQIGRTFKLGVKFRFRP